MANSYESIDAQSIQSPAPLRWWEEEDDGLARAAFSVFNQLAQNQLDHSQHCWQALRMYSGQTQEMYSMGLGTRGVGSGSFSGGTSGASLRAFTYNVCQSVVDSLVAKITASDVNVAFLTEGGRWKLQQKAKKTEQFVEGIFYDQKFHAEAPEVLRNACIFPVGVVKVSESPDIDGKILIENVFPPEILIDPLEAMHRKPRQIFQVRMVSRDVLLERYPDKVDQIKNIKREIDFSGAGNNISDVVTVIEAWHIPDGPDATKKDTKGGIHVLACETCLLSEEPWLKPYLPFVFLRYLTKPIGFYGQSIVEVTMGIQVELNRLLRNQQMGLNLMAVPRWYLFSGSKINSVHINNQIGAIITGDSPEPPVLMKNEPVSEQVQQQIENLFSKAFQLNGMSQLMAQSLKPAGLDSGEALRTYADNQTERYAVVGKAYEQMHLDVADLVVKLAREIHKRDGKFSVKVPGAKFINTVDFGDADLSDDEFTLKEYPTNLLPKTPEGRINAIKDLAELGVIPPEQLVGLLDFPDTKDFIDLYTASVQNIHKITDQMLDGKYSPPEPYQNLQLGIRIVQESLIHAETVYTDIPEENLDLLRQWINQAQAMLQQGAPGASAMMGPQAGASPMANPTATPTSQLLPNVPQPIPPQ